MAQNSEIRVFGMGDKGVNAQMGPLHTDIGDVVVAQNTSFFGNDERGGLSSRLGLMPYAIGLTGSVLAIMSVTFPDTITTTFLTDMDLAVVTDDSLLAIIEG